MSALFYLSYNSTPMIQYILPPLAAPSDQRRPQLRKLLCSLIIFLILMSSAVTAAKARPAIQLSSEGTLPAGLHKDGDFIVPDKFPYKLLNAHQEMRQGEKHENGCAFKGSLTLGPSDMAKEERQIAINPNTCQAKVEIGIPDTNIQSLSGDNNGRPSNSHLSRQNSKGFFHAYYSPGYSKGHTFSKYTDPPGKNVSSVTTYSGWNWNGSCVYGPTYGWSDPYDLWETGWYKTQDSTYHSYDCSQNYVDNQSQL